MSENLRDCHGHIRVAFRFLHALRLVEMTYDVCWVVVFFKQFDFIQPFRHDKSCHLPLQGRLYAVNTLFIDVIASEAWQSRNYTKRESSNLR